MIGLLLAAALLGPTATEVSVPSEPAPLFGTLLQPQGEARAAAVILPGSGPTDRDGNSPLGVSAATYRLLAEGLAEAGIATVRIDKRGIGKSAPAAVFEDQLRFSHDAEDARAWAREAARLTGRLCVWLIGHSEGAMVALAAVEQPEPAVCGLVLLSGPGRPVGQSLREQLASVPEPLKAQAFATLAELEAGRTVAEPPAQLAGLFRPSVQPYFISMLAQRPAEMAGAYAGPIFIGQGSTDVQVPVADAEVLKAARPDATLKLWDGVNHVLKLAPAERAANLSTYSAPGMPLAPGVVADVAAFILSH